MTRTIWSFFLNDRRTSPLAGPTADVSSIAASLSLSITILSSKECTVWTAVPRTIQEGLARPLRKDDKYKSRILLGTIRRRIAWMICTN